MAKSQVDTHIELPKLGHILWVEFFSSGFSGVMSGVMFMTYKIVHDLLLT